MKVCERCGRELKGKRWVRVSPKALAHAKLMGNLEMTKCEECLRHAESHVDKLQVRGRFDREEVEKIIGEELDRFNSGDRMENVFFKGGDYFLTSKNLLRTIARRLRGMGAEIKETSKVVTYDVLHSVSLTRLIVSARFKVVTGDVVRVKSGLDVVTRVSRGWVWTRGHKLKVKDAEVVEVELLEGLVVSERPPMVLIKKTHETVEVEELAGKEGEEITVLRKGKFITTIGD